jgi:hypothetical protein
MAFEGAEPNLYNPRGWSKRYAAAMARQAIASNPERAHNNRVRHAAVRKVEIERELATATDPAKIEALQFGLLEVEEILRQEPPKASETAPVSAVVVEASGKVSAVDTPESDAAARKAKASKGKDHQLKL